jgi:tetratricopeptide (TPR) repeat protein
MQRIPLAFLSAAVLVIGIVVSAIPGDAAPSIDDAYRQMIEKRRGYEAVADRLALTKEFLDHHPDTKYTARLLTHVFYYQGERLDDRPGAIAYAEGVRGKVENPETVRQIDKAMVELYGDANMLNKMIAVADRLEAAGELDFSDYWNIVGAATANEEWKMVRTYCAKARPLANAQAYRADYPERDMTDEEVERAGANRSAMISCKDAWALANLERVDEALTEFEAAGEKINRSYIGVLEYDIGLHWANALLMKGDYDAAIERFAPQALIMGNEDALAGLSRAYTKKTGSDAGFGAFVERLHRQVAPRVEAFELPRYDGTRVKYADLRREVTLLAFWFPT